MYFINFRNILVLVTEIKMTMKKLERKNMNVNELERLSNITLSQCFNCSSTFQSHSMVFNN